MFFKIVLTWLCKVRFLSKFLPGYLQSLTFVINVVPMLIYSVSQALLSISYKRLQIRLSVLLDPIGGK